MYQIVATRRILERRDGHYIVRLEEDPAASDLSKREGTKEKERNEFEVKTEMNNEVRSKSSEVRMKFK